jgi:hypothetical protein
MKTPFPLVHIAVRGCAVCVVATAIGCTSVRLPLCVDLARTTYDSQTSGSEVTSYMRDVATTWHLEMTILSPFAMLVSGNIVAVGRFRKEYGMMVCGFDPQKVTVPHDTYLRCMDHVQTWIQIVQSSEPENLFIQQTEYEPVCASGGGNMQRRR